MLKRRVLPYPSSGRTRHFRQENRKVDKLNIVRFLITGFVAFELTALICDYWFVPEHRAISVWGIVLLGYLTVFAATWVPRLGMLLAICFYVGASFTVFTGLEPIVVFITVIMSIISAERKIIAPVLIAPVLWASAAAIRIGTSDVFWAMLLIEAVSIFIGWSLLMLIDYRARARAEIERLTAENEQIRIDERASLARDLHDLVAHQISLISLQVVGHREADNLDEMRTAMDRIDNCSRSALDELRDVVGILRETDEETKELTVPLRLKNAIDNFTQVLTENNYHVDVAVSGDIENLGLGMQKTMSRIIQESGTNILRYAPQGANCKLAITVKVAVVNLEIINKIASSATQNLAWQSSGWGLRGLKERVSLIGGEFEAGKFDDRWVVRASLKRR
ncbi:MAG: sensor histidine kinase [Propionibacteriaceae bacterium]